MEITELISAKRLRSILYLKLSFKFLSVKNFFFKDILLHE